MKISKVLITFCIACTFWATALFAQPIVTGLSPNFGPIAGGTTITITGSGFTGATAVTFGTVPASFVFVDDSQITATSPLSQVPEAVQVTVTTPSGTSPSSQFAFFVYQGDWQAYVANQTDNTVSVFDASTNGPVSATIPVGSSPQGIAVTPDGLFAYVCNQNANTVSQISLKTNTVTATITVGAVPRDIAITPDGTKAYVSNSSDNTVSVIHIPANTVTSVTGTSFSGPQGIAFTPDGTTAYVCNHGSNVVRVINVAGDTGTSSITVGNGPVGIAITPDGTQALVSNEIDGTASVIALPANTVSTTIIGFSNPLGVAINPNGSNAYVVNNGNNRLLVISLPSGGVVTSIPVGIEPSGVAVTPDGNTVYVTNSSSNSVSVISTATNTVTATIAVGGTPVGIAVAPDKAPVALFASTTATLGGVTTFDATLSQTPTGTITGYAWNFGDGSTLFTTSPIAMHKYATAGTFPVTLTVTDSAGTSLLKVFTGQTMSRKGDPRATFIQNALVSPVIPPSNFNYQIVKKRCSDNDDHKHRKHKKKKGTTETDDHCRKVCIKYTHVLTWTPTSDPTVIAYQLVRNGRLIKTIPASGPFIVIDKRGKKNRTDTYVLVAVNAADVTSAPLTLVIPRQPEFCR